MDNLPAELTGATTKGPSMPTRCFLAALTICLLGCHHSPAMRSPAMPREFIPANWIDLPAAPLVARDDHGTAVLVNRSRDHFRWIQIGCVVEQSGRTHVLHPLAVQDVSGHGWFRHGAKIRGLLSLADLDSESVRKFTGGLVKQYGCPPDARTAVTSTRLGGQLVWSAEGTPWPR